MGLFNRLLETYEANKGIVGVVQEGRIPLAPCCHTAINLTAIITIDKDGNFIEASLAPKAKYIIPVTAYSLIRTNKLAAHPLCERLDYFAKYADDDKGEKKYELYIKELKDWADSAYSNPKVKAVLAYVQKGTAVDDLKKAGIERKNKGNNWDYPVIGWCINGLKEKSGPTWEDTDLINNYVEYYSHKNTGVSQQMVDFITGEVSDVVTLHPKNFSSVASNAKLISANDKEGFTYRGRFEEPEEVANMSFVVSQKVHNTLKWLLYNFGVTAGDTQFICWNPANNKFVDASLLDLIIPTPTEENVTSEAAYKNELNKIIKGYKATIPGDIVLAGFNAATEGRMALTHYEEWGTNNFFDRLYQWYDSCYWQDNKRCYSPVLEDIIDFAFGIYNDEEKRFIIKESKSEGYKRPKRNLQECRLGLAKMPVEIVNALINRCRQLDKYPKGTRLKLLFITCAVLRKYYYDMTGEQINIMLDVERKDRSYQFGRLLAVLEKMEYDTYSKEDTEKKTPNAIRAQSQFRQRPLATTEQLIRKLESYKNKLSLPKRIYYERLIAEIMTKIDGPDSNKLLNDTYLLGYYAQNVALWSPSEKNVENNEENA